MARTRDGMATNKVIAYLMSRPVGSNGTIQVRANEVQQATQVAQPTVSGILQRLAHSPTAGVRQIKPGLYEIRRAVEAKPAEAPKPEREPEEEKTRYVSLAADVTRLLNRRPGELVTVGDVAEELGALPTSVATVLRRLSDRNALTDVHLVQRGVYVYRPEAGRRAPEVPEPEAEAEEPEPAAEAEAEAEAEAPSEELIWERIPGTTESGGIIQRASDGSLWEARRL